MQPFYKDNHDILYNMDFRENDLPDESVQMVCTSPPYWGLRKYSGEQELIWGDKDCEHKWVDYNSRTYQQGQGMDELAKVWKTGGKPKAGETELSDGTVHKLSHCSVCGAWKGAYGLEPTPEMYVQHTIEILREVRRVLRKDGVVFWNVGDSYASGKGTCYNPGGNTSSFNVHLKEANVHPLDRGNKSTLAKSGLKPKDLVMIPFRVALAAQADGWYVRSDIIWSKPNPMPESVTDRPTNSHEHILMLTKSARYFWDMEAVRVPLAEGSWERSQRSELNAHSESRIRNKGTGQHGRANILGRNLRSVWTFPTQPYPEAHFAVFPEKLPEICIKVATPEVGCCSKCGAPWERIVETKVRYRRQKSENEKYPIKPIDGVPGIDRRFDHDYVADRETTNWVPTCKCNADKVPSICLDPFNGAGTTLKVAKKLNRRAIGFDTSEEYCRLAVERIRQQGLL